MLLMVLFNIHITAGIHNSAISITEISFCHPDTSPRPPEDTFILIVLFNHWFFFQFYERWNAEIVKCFLTWLSQVVNHNLWYIIDKHINYWELKINWVQRWSVANVGGVVIVDWNCNPVLTILGYKYNYTYW